MSRKWQKGDEFWTCQVSNLGRPLVEPLLTHCVWLGGGVVRAIDGRISFTFESPTFHTRQEALQDGLQRLRRMKMAALTDIDKAIACIEAISGILAINDQDTS